MALTGLVPQNKLGSRLKIIDSSPRPLWEDGSHFERRPVPGDIGSIALRKSGGLVLSLADGFYFLDAEPELP